MFYKYLLINDEGNKVLYLYVDNNFEFGSMDYKKDKDPDKDKEYTLEECKKEWGID